MRFVIYFIHTAHLDAPRLVTRPSDRKAVWRWENLDPFGANAAEPDPSGLGDFDFNLRFPGQYFDAETGLHYNYYRDFDPAIGRYIQSDPIGLDGGINTYIFVYDSPLSLSDPQGLMGRGSRGSGGGYWGRQPKPGGPQPNGNLRPGYTEQDWRCSMGGEFSNDFGCWRQCCLEHDLCFQKHRCNQSSWGGPIGSACQECNLTFLKCMALGSPKDRCQKGCSTTFLGAP